MRRAMLNYLVSLMLLSTLQIYWLLESLYLFHYKFYNLEILQPYAVGTAPVGQPAIPLPAVYPMSKFRHSNVLLCTILHTYPMAENYIISLLLRKRTSLQDSNFINNMSFPHAQSCHEAFDAK